MAKNIALGFTIALLVFIGLLSYAQERHECLNGHLITAFKPGHGRLIKAFKPCGSVSPSM